MKKVMAVLRTVFLLFIFGFTVRALPMFGQQMTRTLDEQYSRCVSNFELAEHAAWYAIAWIAFETAMGWWLATRKPKGAPPGSKVATPPPTPAA